MPQVPQPLSLSWFVDLFLGVAGVISKPRDRTQPGPVKGNPGSISEPRFHLQRAPFSVGLTGEPLEIQLWVLSSEPDKTLLTWGCSWSIQGCGRWRDHSFTARNPKWATGLGNKKTGAASRKPLHLSQRLCLRKENKLQSQTEVLNLSSSLA